MDSVCRICLIGNIRMLDVDNIHLLKMYETLTNTKLNTETEYGMPSTVCYVCHRELQKCHKLSQMAKISNGILQDLFQCGIEATHDTVTKMPLEIKQKLSVTPTHYMHINDYPLQQSLVEDTEMCNDLNNSVLSSDNEIHTKNKIIDIYTEAKPYTNDYLDTVSTPLLTVKEELDRIIVTKEESNESQAFVDTEMSNDLKNSDNEIHTKNKIIDIHIEAKPYTNDYLDTVSTPLLTVKEELDRINVTKEESYETQDAEELQSLVEDTEIAKTIDENLLPEKSKERYIAAYYQFIKWRNEKKTSSCSENVLLAYFGELANKYKPSSLWSTYSMLKTTLQSKDGINIKEYTKLTAFLKRQSDGYVSKKSKVLTGDNVKKFINEAPDEKYLATKVALIFGVTGACRRQELSEITTDDIENHGDILFIKIPHTKIPRSFVVHGKYYKIVKKYESLRTKKTNSNRFFQQFRNGKCTAQVIGRNKFGNMPKEIAEYLNLPDSNSYTGHTFRRTSATWLADSGADMTLKRHREWKSSNFAEVYIEDSISSKKAKSIMTSCDPKPSTSFPDFEPKPCASTWSATGETQPCASTATFKLEPHRSAGSSDTSKNITISINEENMKY